MIAAFEGLLARRWRVVLVAVAVAVGLVTLWAYLTPKHWQASVVVQLDPVVVPGLREDSATPVSPTPDDAADAELAIARGDAFQEGLASNVDYPFTLAVDPGPDPATLRFTADAGSAERSVAAAYAGANGFIAWGRAQQAVSRRAALQRELDALAPGDPAAADLEARIEVADTALAQLDGGGGTVVGRPVVPDDPVAPNLAARLVAAALVGLAVGLGLAWRADRRRAGGPVPARVASPERAAGAHPGARRALVVVAVAALAMPLAGVIAGVVGVWELRPTTNAQDEAGYACLPGWLDDLPDGTVVAVSGDTPRFFADHLQEFAFPRLQVPPPGTDPEVLLTIVAGPGPDLCGGFHREVSGP